ncbi:tetratricopeptide repeat protein, partial [Geitlerinema sp. P-1104]|uniref:tetratricopeptide repeat protein n=1 Tax=Geitlerinema sp. P-1104 TaxID=2546230 RepID=UPI00336BB776
MEAAIADFNEAITLAPDARDPYLDQGIAYEALGDWTKAIADCDQVLSLNPEDAIADNNRGNAKGGQGDWPGATERLALTTRALKEYLGLWVYQLRGWA